MLCPVDGWGPDSSLAFGKRGSLFLLVCLLVLAQGHEGLFLSGMFVYGSSFGILTEHVPIRLVTVPEVHGEPKGGVTRLV